MSIDFDYKGVPHTLDPWSASRGRYDSMVYRRVGNSGLILPAISLGLWYNFGDNRPFDIQREVLRHAFDKGITHFDLANNYGPPHGSAEENFGRMMRSDFRPYRHELILSTKAGWDMWPGPQGQLGSRNYLLSSLDDSLRRLSIDYVDIFYSHRFDPVTPLDETVGALASAVRSGKARYVGISSYSAQHTAEAKAIADRAGISLVIHQPSYNLLNRWIDQASQTRSARPAWARSRSRPSRRACSPTGTQPKMPPTSTAPPHVPPFPQQRSQMGFSQRFVGLKPSPTRVGNLSRRWHSHGCCATQSSHRRSSARRASLSSTKTSAR